MGKKTLKIAILFIIILNMFSQIIYADDEEEEESDYNELEAVIETAGKIVDEPSLNAKSAIIYDRESKRILYGKNENEKRAMASTTKIMSAIIVLENADLNNTVIISKKAANTGGSRLKINEEDKITVNDLLYGLMLRSGNDAAVALAEYVGGSIEDFASLMNKKAEELGLVSTHFVTPHGLDNDDHYTTAYELAKLTDYALNNETFAKIVGTKSYNIKVNNQVRTINNTNELLGNYEGVNGVKTGFTGNAMRCLVTSYTKNDNQIITVVLGADTKKQRTQDSIKLLKYADQNFERINLEEEIQNQFNNWKQINKNRIIVNKAENNNIDFKLSEINNKVIPIKNNTNNEIRIEINCLYNYDAPIDKDIKVGSIVVKYKDEIIETIDIFTKNEIRKKSVENYMFNFFEIFTSCLDFYN